MENVALLCKIVEKLEFSTKCLDALIYTHLMHDIRLDVLAGAFITVCGTQTVDDVQNAALGCRFNL